MFMVKYKLGMETMAFTFQVFLELNREELLPHMEVTRRVRLGEGGAGREKSGN